MSLIQLFSKYAPAKPHKLHGENNKQSFAQASPLYKWKRKDGLATFLRNMIDLRKTLSLCKSCESKMPTRWLSRYNYELVKGHSADDCPCDYCRELTTVNLYVAGEGAYWREYDLGRRSVLETTRRERSLLERDARYIFPM